MNNNSEPSEGVVSVHDHQFGELRYEIVLGDDFNKLPRVDEGCFLSVKAGYEGGSTPVAYYIQREKSCIPKYPEVLHGPETTWEELPIDIQTEIIECLSDMLIDFSDTPDVD